MKRILIVQRELTHYRKQLVDYIQAQGEFEVEICCINNKTKHSDNAHCFPTKEHLKYKNYKLQYSKDLIAYVKQRYWQYDYIILEGAPNVVNNISICSFLRQHNKPYIIWDAGRRNNSKMSTLRRLAQRPLEQIWKHASAIIAYSTLAKAYFVGIGIPKEKIFVCQNTLVVEDLDQQIRDTTAEMVADIKRQVAPKDEKIILYVGAVEARKRVRDLIDAFELVHETGVDAVLVIIGAGERMEETQQYAHSKGLPIHMLGAIIDGVIPFFLAADVFALPSEGGLSINQAMSCAKPVIASSADGTELDLIENGKNGFFFEEKNAKDLAEKILLVLNDENSRVRMGIASRRIIDEKVNERVFYRNLLECLRVVDTRRDNDG